MHVIFYRNLNLGHAGSPSRDELESALLDAGATRAKSFQTNGTVLLDAPSPEKVVSAAADSLASHAGYEDSALLREVGELKDVLELGVFERHQAASTYRETVTLFEGGSDPLWSLPWTNPKDDVDVLYLQDGLALSRIRKPRNTAGSPTLELERATGGVATTRTRGSLERLLKAPAAWN